MGGRGASGGGGGGGGGGGKIAAATKGFEHAKSNLPALKGSPKQIAWAEKIRSSYINSTNTRLDIAKRVGGNSADLTFAHNATYNLGRNEAAYWIENRNSLSR